MKVTTLELGQYPKEKAKQDTIDHNIKIKLLLKKIGWFSSLIICLWFRHRPLQPSILQVLMVSNRQRKPIDSKITQIPKSIITKKLHQVLLVKN